MSYYEYLPHSTSDYSPMHIHLINATRKSCIPFRFFNNWQQAEGFQDILKGTWSIQVAGLPMFQVVKKLKYMKIELKQWRKNSFDSPSVKIHQLRGKLKEGHNKLVDDPTNVQIRREELLLQDKLGTWLAHEEDQ